jgi:hypothetical protein
VLQPVASYCFGPLEMARAQRGELQERGREEREASAGGGEGFASGTWRAWTSSRTLEVELDVISSHAATRPRDGAQSFETHPTVV